MSGPLAPAAAPSPLEAPPAPQRLHQLLDRLAAQAPGHPFLHHPDGRQTSAAQLAALADALVDALRADGVGQGDRVLVVAENCTGHIALLMALSRLGAIACGLNARLSPGEVAAFAAQADARLAVYTPGASDDAAAHAQRAGARPPGIAGLAFGPVNTAAQPATAAEAQGVAAIIFTSGTTGAPKGVMVSHAGLLHFAQVSARSRGLTPADRAYACLPMTHIFGLATVLTASLSAGCGLLLRSRFTPDDLLQAMAQHGLSQLQGPPMLFSRLLAHLDAAGIQRPHAPDLRYLYTGSAPMDLALKAEVQARLALPLHHGYGLSEYAGSLILTQRDAPRQDTSVGQLAPGAQLRVVSPDDGHDLPAGHTGELWIRGPGLMPGYWRDPAATANVMRPGGWYATGDLGRVDPADGAVFIMGRLKELIIRSGFNVYPAEVEAVLNSHPAVRLSAVWGQRQADGNEQVCAAVELRDGASLDDGELQGFLAQRLAPYKRPAAVQRLAALPVTPNGKVLKRVLAAAAGRS